MVSNLSTPNLVHITELGSNRNAPRFWAESSRLANLGFEPGVNFGVEAAPDGIGLRLRVSPTGERTFSRKRDAGAFRPVIDINSAGVLGRLAEFGEIKVSGSHKLISIDPTRRAFAIMKHRESVKVGPIEVLEFFTGGGTISQAFHSDPRFKIVGAVELEPTFSDAYTRLYPETPLFLMDARRFDPADAPRASVVFASLPCTCFSSAGVSKKGLKGRSEFGDTGDLFMPLLHVILHQKPLAAVIENVPEFGTSYAGMFVAETLKRHGYHVSEAVLEPHSEWGEIQDRRRYVLVATLDAPFAIRSPGTAFAGTAADFLDPLDATADEADADRIANTVATLDKHFAKHAAMGHGFGYTVIDHASTKMPTITRSYHKINNGPFVRTPSGRVRMLRKHELERIFGATADTPLYSTAVEILGQGTLSRVFARLFADLADHLTGVRPVAPVAFPAPAVIEAPRQLALW